MISALVSFLITSIASILPASLWRPIILACASLQRKSFTDTFWGPQFSIWRLKKKFWSPVGPCQKKLISDMVFHISLPSSKFTIFIHLSIKQLFLALPRDIGFFDFSLPNYFTLNFSYITNKITGHLENSFSLKSRCFPLLHLGKQFFPQISMFSSTSSREASRS